MESAENPLTLPEPAETTETVEKAERPGWQRFGLETLQTIILALILYFAIDTVIARVRVENISMKPTLQPGEFLVVEKVSRYLNHYEAGNIVVFHYPPNPEEDFIKRIIGIEGDRVVIKNGQVIVNGTALEEPYVSALPHYTGSWMVPAHNVFVLGDNRNQSSDSHSWGFVPVENIVGKAVLVYWPLNELQILNNSLGVEAANG